MNAERWQRIEDLFHEASSLPPERQAAWLAHACGGDRDLETEVLRLLAGDQRSEHTVRQMIAEASSDLMTGGVGPETFRNARIGSWRIDRLLGEGGMGLVFLAHRDDGRFEQDAAIKLLRFTLAAAADVNRFRRERRILARLDHPHIARLLDAGEHPLGPGLEIPYFVMEHVAGSPLTVYVREHELGTRQRIALALQVLDAVGYAHQHFILHRDLKPANILVTSNGVVKLLDFGIAQLLETDSTSAHDRTRSTLMTPDYASPEQLRGDPLTVQSDVFTLGALLYELLADRQPYGLPHLTPHTDRAVAMTNTPAPPLGLDSDLDTIVAKAMHPELARRYQSVEALAADLRRYLAGQPVSARKDSGWYRARKFTARHRWPLTAAAVLVLSLAGGVVATAYEARRANQHLDQLRQLSGRLLFQVHDAVESLQGATKARELLATTSAEYLDGLSADAGDDPAVLNDLGGAYERLGRIFGGPNGGHLGRTADSIAAYQKADAIFARLESIAPNYPDVALHQARVLVSMGRVQALNGDADHAVVTLRAAYEAGRRATATGQPLVIEALDSLLYLGDVLVDRGKPREALALYQQALPDTERHAALDPSMQRQRALTNVRVRIGQTEVFLGALDSARDEFQRAVDRTNALAVSNPDDARVQRDVFLMMDRLATVTGHADHPNLGDPSGAARMYEGVIAQARRVSDKDPQDMRAKRDLAEMYASRGATLRVIDPPHGREDYLRALDIYRSLPESMTKAPNIEQWIAQHHRGLAISLAGLGQVDAALGELDRALAVFRRLDLPQDIGQTLLEIGRLRRAKGDVANGRVATTEAIATFETLRKENRDDVSLRRDLADAYAEMAQIQATGRDCAGSHAWMTKSETLWREIAGTEASAFAGSELKKLAGAAPHCG